MVLYGSIAQIYFGIIKIRKMQESFKLIKCPNQHNAQIVCLTHTCQASSPFVCDIKNCKCSHLHPRCKTMKLEAYQDYLINWQKWIGKGSKEFMSRVIKIYANARDKLEREQKIFEDYCKELFLGKDHSQAEYLIQKREFNQLTSQLLSSSVRKITESTQPMSFEPFTVSQMRKIDDKIKQLMESVEELYKIKEVKMVEPQRITRCNSASLQRSNSFGQKQLTKSFKFNQNPFNDIIKLKVDLSYPKSINSKVVQDATSLNKIIGKKIKKYHLAYRGTQSSFNISEFYRKINIIYDKLQSNHLKNNHKPQIITIILVKTEFGKVIGGFTPLKWQRNTQKHQNIESQQDELNPQSHYHAERKKHGYKLRCDNLAATNVFSLDLMERYDLLKPQEAIYCGKTSIGFGRSDIRIVQKGNSHRKNYCKFPNSYNYQKQPYLNISKSGMSLSGSKYSPFFKLQEWQAFLAQL